MTAEFLNAITALRFLSIDSVENAQSGHPGLPMGMADVATVLFQEFLKFYPKDPAWPNRDRFILSAGHGSALLYSLLHLCHYEGMTIEQLKKFRKLGSLTPGHPEFGHTPGVEATTGPLGQGIAMAVGMALGQKIRAARHEQQGGDPTFCDHKIYVIVSDGDLMEGISQEAISFAGHLGLSNLIVLFDDNAVTIDGPTSLATSDLACQRFKASNWETLNIDGHNHDAIRQALTKAQLHLKPTLIACKTTIGYGAPSKAGTAACHGSPLGAQEMQQTREALHWPHPPFEIPQDIRAFWLEKAMRHEQAYKAWYNRVNNLDAKQKDVLLGVKQEVDAKIFHQLQHDYRASSPSLATRLCSQQVLEKLIALCPNIVGGSADLTPSNNTKVAGHKALTPTDYKGNYIHFGIREHAMAAILNGLSLYGGFIPYGGTFLVFSDYLRPALRLSALMKRQVIYVLTHDSIGLGEDGPTHQPVEHLATLRAIPNVYVFRPCDGVETAQCWQTALTLSDSPSILALSRQNLPTLHREGNHAISFENICQKGGYILVDTAHESQLTFIATGSEVQLAVKAAQLLKDKNIHVRVVSMPCLDLFEEQDDVYKKRVIGEKPCIVIEAGIEMGWHKYTHKGAFIGMTTFGASGPANDLYAAFHITTQTLINTAERILQQ